MDRIFNYKYYALHRYSTQAMGILNEEMGELTFHDLVVEKIKDQFSGNLVDTIMRHPDIGDKKMKAVHLLEDLEQYELTKEYRKCLEHLTGKKWKAINTNDSTVG